MKSRFTSLIATIAALAFLYLPILTLVLQSFNKSRFGGEWQDFSLRWYEALFNDAAILDATLNTFIIAVVSTVFSTILGTLAAWVLYRYRTRLQEANYILVYSPLVMPEILMGISLLLLFVSVGVDLGLFTVVLAHITFCVSFVAFTVLARLQDFDFQLIQAAQDLGADWGRIVLKIILPLLAPGIAAGAMMAFTLSMDDFVITFFVGGPGSTTLPVKVFSMMKHGSPAVINALSVIFMAITFGVAILGQIIANRTSV